MSLPFFCSRCSLILSTTCELDACRAAPNPSGTPDQSPVFDSKAKSPEVFEYLFDWILRDRNWSKIGSLQSDWLYPDSDMLLTYYLNICASLWCFLSDFSRNIFVFRAIVDWFLERTSIINFSDVVDLILHLVLLQVFFRVQLSTIENSSAPTTELAYLRRNTSILISGSFGWGLRKFLNFKRYACNITFSRFFLL